ncbi:TetR/AcrR family transcriptional regulator [Mycolicibacter senuensis]|uniref:TetR/AcrR family transcriptional regulator n=1 Tax=Mycolicibacter senuensis TaxID=386913 RepID=UPI000DCDE6A6|nr:TetR/AcrR family transcriptional regulator [Mycolicibacter senuensis]RAV02788.1 TetR family transcriptional regulator [Mycolicibacter senuensis]
MTVPDKTRRPGYAPPLNPTVGRRGLHTRERILACAADLFRRQGYHGTSIDAIAKVADASRPTIYQYFAGKEGIFRELVATSEQALLDHGDRLRRLGPDTDGLRNLSRWLREWADIYDAHAAVFAEFPGIGTAAGLSVIDVGSVADAFRHQVTNRVRAAEPVGLQPDEAVAALTRIPHMVNLYRYRRTFPLPSRTDVSGSLAVALQLMLFPDTPLDAIGHVCPPRSADRSEAPLPAARPAVGPAQCAMLDLSPIGQEILAASSQLFAERGYYAVGMEDIAAAVSISRATLYRYFSTKHTILAEVTRRAMADAERHATALHGIADATFDAGRFTDWMLGYVRFHRGYRGVIRAWFDGTVAEQLSAADVEHGIGSMYQAVAALLRRATLPPGLDPLVAAAVFLAVLGRMTEPVPGSLDSDRRAAELMVRLLRHSLLRFD